MLDVIKTSASPVVFQAFFSVVHPLSLDEDRFVVQVDSPLVVDWLRQKYAATIEATLQQLCGRPIRLVLQCDASATTVTRNEVFPDDCALPSPPDPPVEFSLGVRRGRSLPSNLNPYFTFENFIVGSSNRMAHAAAFATAQNPGRVYNPLFIYGGVGLGKTHLMQAIGHAVLSRDERCVVHYVSCERFINQFIEAIQTSTLSKFRDLFRSSIDVLLIDDIQFLSKKEGLQEEFYHTFNDLHNQGKQIVMTSDKSPQELEHIENRLVNRFEWGMVVDIQSPDFETRVAIIRKKLETFGKTLDDDVCYYLANRVRNDVRKIEGALIRLLGFASVQNKPVTLEMAKECLKDYVTAQAPITLESIQKAVAEFFDVRVGDLRSNRRPKMIAHPRQVAMYLCRDLTDSSLTDIAQSFGGKDHTTVLYACRKIDALKRTDEQVEQQIAALRKRILESTQGTV
ncbi:MAG: chromosomal replication initiator protein DnaA [bacterium]|nr:chromosomal replication initiator protein DnaA [bacterium]